MFEKAILPLALGACLAFAAPAWAEGDSPDNPKPLADDVALPLPCGVGEQATGQQQEGNGGKGA